MPDGTVRKVPEHEAWFAVADDGLFEVRVPVGYLELEDHLIPAVLQFRTMQQEPQLYFEVQTTALGARLTEFAFISRDPDSQGIRQVDFREVQVSAILEDLLTLLTFRAERDENGDLRDITTAVDDTVNMRRFVSRVGRRDITPTLLENVAKVYRDNIDGFPTKAVQHHFQVSQRTAAGYVAKARQRGLLPPTKRGKKNA